MKILISILTFGLFFKTNAQSDSLKVKFSGFIETYYAFDFSNPTTDKKLSFMYNYNRHNEFSINNAVLRTQLEFENMYASIAFHAGTYVNDNYASEEVKILSEAFIGVFLDKNKKSSIEMGILPSYIGFESATSFSNLTLTRSILAESSPYFMTGLKYNYKPNEQWSFSGFLTNGWQRINKPEKDVSPSFGTQVVYKLNSNSILNWSTFIGKEYNGEIYSTRYFNNLFWDSTWNNKWRTILGFDYGFHEHKWYSLVFISQYSINPKWQTALRLEYNQDINNVIIETDYGFKSKGTSINIDYLINSKLKFRTEARYFDTENSVFYNQKNDNLFVTSSLAFEF